MQLPFSILTSNTFKIFYSRTGCINEETTYAHFSDRHTFSRVVGPVSNLYQHLELDVERISRTNIFLDTDLIKLKPYILSYMNKHCIIIQSCNTGVEYSGKSLDHLLENL